VYSLGVPVATIDAEHDGGPAAAASADAFNGLEAQLKLAVGARVMHKSNTWTEAGLVNGQLGTVKAIVYREGVSPPDLPRAVIVEFPNYIGDGCFGLPHHVAVTPNEVTAPVGSGTAKRRQLPLVLAFGITIHKSHKG
jgi:ATP-dependent exoDNAse (exonuclease V) alpha subunit